MVALDDAACASITHWCVMVSGGEGGYYLESYRARFVACDNVTTDIINCQGDKTEFNVTYIISLSACNIISTCMCVCFWIDILFLYEHNEHTCML